MSFNPVEIWAHMSLAVKALALVMAGMSLATVGVMFARLIVFAREQRRSMAYAAEVIPALRAADVDELARVERDDRQIGYLGRVFQQGLIAYRTAPDGFSDYAFESVARALEQQSMREVESLRWGTGVLGTIATTAPFVGLLATVIGIVNAFQQMSVHGSGGLSVISAGIAEALVGTAAGLLVAIPAVFFVSYLSQWVEQRQVDVASAGNDLLNAVGRTLKLKERAQREERLREHEESSLFGSLLDEDDISFDELDEREISQPGPREPA
jgi:biopolymer transport protein ExbB/biopolymer transport protein TolQ